MYQHHTRGTEALLTWLVVVGVVALVAGAYALALYHFVQHVAAVIAR